MYYSVYFIIYLEIWAREFFLWYNNIVTVSDLAIRFAKIRKERFDFGDYLFNLI